MSLFKGETLSVEIFGESHGKSVGAKVCGMPKFTFDEQKLSDFLSRRKSSGKDTETKRVEKDLPVFSGVKDGKVKGKFSVEIANANVNKGDYKDLYAKPRPSSADYVRYIKDGTLDFSGGGRFSGRLTAPLCVVGGICKQYLEQKGIFVEGYVSQVGKVKGKSYKTHKLSYEKILEERKGDFPSLDKKQEMTDEILSASKDGDSVGGKIECIVFGIKGGYGDNLFGGLEGKIASLLYSIPAVKGVEFGLGFDFASKSASKVNDFLTVKDGKTEHLSNNCGGIDGGITNGENITLSVAFKPTPSISKEQKTVDLSTMQNTVISIKGRHDPCIVKRAVPVVESAVCIALLDIVGK